MLEEQKLAQESMGGPAAGVEPETPEPAAQPEPEVQQRKVQIPECSSVSMAWWAAAQLPVRAPARGVEQ